MWRSAFTLLGKSKGNVYLKLFWLELYPVAVVSRLTSADAVCRLTSAAAVSRLTSVDCWLEHNRHPGQLHLFFRSVFLVTRAVKHCKILYALDDIIIACSPHPHGYHSEESGSNTDDARCDGSLETRVRYVTTSGCEGDTERREEFSVCVEDNGKFKVTKV